MNPNKEGNIGVMDYVIAQEFVYDNGKTLEQYAILQDGVKLHNAESIAEAIITVKIKKKFTNNPDARCYFSLPNGVYTVLNI